MQTPGAASPAGPATSNHAMSDSPVVRSAWRAAGKRHLARAIPGATTAWAVVLSSALTALCVSVLTNLGLSRGVTLPRGISTGMVAALKAGTIGYLTHVAYPTTYSVKTARGIAAVSAVLLLGMRVAIDVAWGPSLVRQEVDEDANSTAFRVGMTVFNTVSPLLWYLLPALASSCSARGAQERQAFQAQATADMVAAKGSKAASAAENGSVATSTVTSTATAAASAPDASSTTAATLALATEASPTSATTTAATNGGAHPDAHASPRRHSVGGMRTACVVVTAYGILTHLLEPWGVDIVWVAPLTALPIGLGLKYDSRKGFKPVDRDWGYVVMTCFITVALPKGVASLTSTLVYDFRDDPFLQTVTMTVAQTTLGVVFSVWRSLTRVALGSYEATVGPNLFYMWVTELFFALVFIQLPPFGAAFWGFLVLNATRNTSTQGFLQWDLLRCIKARQAKWPPQRPLMSVLVAWHRAEQSMLVEVLAVLASILALATEVVLLDVGVGARGLTAAAAPDEVPRLFAGLWVVLLSQLPVVYIVRWIHKAKLRTAEAAEHVARVGRAEGSDSRRGGGASPGRGNARTSTNPLFLSRASQRWLLTKMNDSGRAAARSDGGGGGSDRGGDAAASGGGGEAAVGAAPHDGGDIPAGNGIKRQGSGRADASGTREVHFNDSVAAFWRDHQTAFLAVVPTAVWLSVHIAATFSASKREM